MKILHVNMGDFGSQDIKSIERLQEGLEKKEIECELLSEKESQAKNASRRLFQLSPWAFDQIPVRMCPKKGRELFSPAWVHLGKILKQIEKSAPDIVHLHTIQGGRIKIEDLALIHRPIVWSLHDMWPFTGGCHDSLGCDKYKTLCGACPILGSSKAKDLSTQVFERKKRAFTHLNFTVVGLSQWITNQASESVLLQGKRILYLPNPLDTHFFQSIDKKMAREILGLPLDKKLVLFENREDLEKETRITRLLEAFQELKRQKVEMVVLGSALETSLDFPIHGLGDLQDDISRKIVYSAIDVLVEPSSRETISPLLLESLSCATPVVAFRHGPYSETIEHGQNGYLAKPFDPKDLGMGLDWIFYHPNYKQLCLKAREKALENYAFPKVLPAYQKLYEEVVANKNTSAS